MEASEAAKNALENVLDAVAGESIVIVCDDEKREIGKAFVDGAVALGLWTRFMVLKTGKQVRTEVPAHLLEVLTRQKPDIYVNLMRDLMEETPLRIRIITLETRDQRARLGHCPGVALDMLTEGALALTVEEHKRMQDMANRLMQALQGTLQLELRSPAGTDLKLVAKERTFYTDTKYDWQLKKWMNLPTGEVIVAPIENSLTGRLVCDMAIGGIGPIKTPVEIIAKNGKAEKVTCKDKDVLRQVKGTLATDDWSNVVGEFALGINPKARFVEQFLEAEKMFGTAHVAFGHNTDMPGGKNPSKDHMDFLMSKPTVKITKDDGKTVTVLDKGRFKV